MNTSEWVAIVIATILFLVLVGLLFQWVRRHKSGECLSPSCQRPFPWFARLQGWKKRPWRCPDHLNYTVGQAMAELMAKSDQLMADHYRSERERHALEEQHRRLTETNREIETIATAAPAEMAPVIRDLLIHSEFWESEKPKRVAAVRNLADAPTSSSVAALSLATRDPAYDVGAAAIEALRDLKQYAPLIPILHDNRFSAEAATALGEIGDPVAVAPLKEVWADRYADPLAKAKAAEALIRIGGSEVRSTILQVLKYPDTHIRRRALKALKDAGREEAITFICAIARSDDALRREAIEAISELRAPGAVPLLIKLLDSRDDWVAGDAAEALGKIGDTRAAEAVLTAYKKLPPDDPDRGRFVAALEQLQSDELLDETPHEIIPNSAEQPFERKSLNISWQEFAAKKMTQTTAHLPELCLRFESSAMAESILRLRPSSTSRFLHEQPFLTEFTDGTAAMFELESGKDTGAFVDELLSGDYGDQKPMVINGILVGASDKKATIDILGVPQAMSFGDVMTW